jgi:multiple sugar transport system permease protein
MTQMSTRPQRRKRLDFGGTVVPIVAMILLCFLYGAPLLTLVVTSLQSPGVLPSLSPQMLQNISLESYQAVFAVGAGQALLNSLIIATGVTIIVLGLGVPGAYWLARTAPRVGAIALLVLVFLQMVPAASSVIPLYRVLASWGLIGTTTGVILTAAAALLPFAILLLSPFFIAIPRELSEAAAVDGAGQVGVFLRIILPLVQNGVVTVGLLTFMISWGEFVYAINFLSRPDQYPASALLTQFLQPYFTDWPGLMAASVVTALPVIVLFLVFQRRLSAGLSAGAIKG